MTASDRRTRLAVSWPFWFEHCGTISGKRSRSRFKNERSNFWLVQTSLSNSKLLTSLNQKNKSKLTSRYFWLFFLTVSADSSSLDKQIDGILSRTCVDVSIRVMASILAPFFCCVTFSIFVMNKADVSLSFSMKAPSWMPESFGCWLESLETCVVELWLAKNN